MAEAGELEQLEQLEPGQVEALRLLVEQGWAVEAAVEVLGVSVEAARAVLPAPVEEPLADPSGGGVAWASVRVVDGSMVRARVTRLWGEVVQVNDRGDVYCGGCWEFVPVTVLSAPNHGHQVGPRVRGPYLDFDLDRDVESPFRGGLG